MFPNSAIRNLPDAKLEDASNQMFLVISIVALIDNWVLSANKMTIMIQMTRCVHYISNYRIMLIQII